MSNLITVKNCTSQEEALSFLNKIDHSYDLELILLIFKESFNKYEIFYKDHSLAVTYEDRLI